MAIQDMSAADLAAVMDNNDGFGGGNGWWIILLFLFLGWGNNGWGGNNTSNDVYPLMENQQNLFTGFSSLQNAICAGFANAETAATSRQMADMNRVFDLQSQLSQCCCENRLATQQLNTTIAQEACANRQAISDGVKEIIVNQNSNTQRILDWLCDNKIDQKNDEIQQLRTQLQVQNLAASQIAQTAQIIDALKPTTAAA